MTDIVLHCVYAITQQGIDNELSPSFVFAWDEYDYELRTEEFEARLAEVRADPQWAAVREVKIQVRADQLASAFRAPLILGDVEASDIARPQPRFRWLMYEGNWYIAGPTGYTGAIDVEVMKRDGSTDQRSLGPQIGTRYGMAVYALAEK